MEGKAAFEHKVSKGSRFNQIYIPTSMNRIFEVGDLVEVKLVKKKEQIYHSKNLEYLGEFKLSVIKQIFSVLGKFTEIGQIFVVGSFLTQKADYNDIDIIVISGKKRIEEKAYFALSEKLPLKFHILAISEENLEKLLKSDPLIRSMLFYFASNKKFELPEKTEIDTKHLEFLLMMPEDLLKISISDGRMYYDSLRRLIAIKRFVGKQNTDPVLMDKELKSSLGNNFYFTLKKNEPLDKKTIENAQNIIRKQLILMRKILT